MSDKKEIEPVVSVIMLAIAIVTVVGFGQLGHDGFAAMSVPAQLGTMFGVVVGLLVVKYLL